MRYSFNDSKLDALAALKFSTSESGAEYQILDMDKGTVERYAEYRIEVEG